MMVKNIVTHVLNGFTSIVDNLYGEMNKIPSILSICIRLCKYLSVIVVGLIVYDHYYPILENSKFYLILLIMMPVTIVTPAIVYWIYINFGGGNWLFNWHLQITSRYLDFCELQLEDKRMLLPKNTEKWLYQLAGSSVDGFGFFPLVSANSGIFPWSETVLVQDIDINIFRKGFEVSPESLINTLPGFYQVNINRGQTKEFIFLNDCLACFESQCLLSGESVTKKIGDKLAQQVDYNYPAITFTTSLKGPRGKFQFNADLVFGIKLSECPPKDKEWLNRIRDKFPADVVEDLAHFTYFLVHRPCSQTNTHLDWRLSFTEAESKLFYYHTNKKALKLCYAIIKFEIKRSCQKLENEYLALKSYHLKTLLLWIAEEQNSLYDMVNVEKNETLVPLFLYILSQYRKHMYDGFLQHYFLKDVNLLEPYDADNRRKSIKLLDTFIKKPLSVISHFDTANMNLWSFHQFYIVSILIVIAAMNFSQYFSNINEWDEIFGPISTFNQIAIVCVVFSMIWCVKIFLD